MIETKEDLKDFVNETLKNVSIEIVKWKDFNALGGHYYLKIKADLSCKEKMRFKKKLKDHIPKDWHIYLIWIKPDEYIQKDYR